METAVHIARGGLPSRVSKIIAEIKFAVSHQEHDRRIALLAELIEIALSGPAAERSAAAIYIEAELNCVISAPIDAVSVH